MEFTTLFGLHCQATRLQSLGRREGASPAKAWHPLWASHAREDSRDAPVPARHRPERYSSPRTRAQGVSALGYSRFTRRYWGSPRWFLFLRLLKCFSSAGILVRYEVGDRPSRESQYDARKLSAPSSKVYFEQAKKRARSPHSALERTIAFHPPHTHAHTLRDRGVAGGRAGGKRPRPKTEPRSTTARPLAETKGTGTARSVVGTENVPATT